MTLLTYHPPVDPYLVILHQDDDIVVINKPGGLLSVPGKALEHYDSAWSRLVRVLPTTRVVHRLDMATSGLLVFALNKPAQAALQRQFEKRLVSKSYRARVWGQPPAEAGSVNAPLRCDWPNRPRQMVDHEAGRHALTHYRVLHQHQQCADVELTPVTGRSHQLRVHMQLLGNPILGDKFYAEGAAFAAADRLLLHAERIEFSHPVSGKPMSFVCPADF
ncbi:RluA family pseudouridine synthase [Pseudidiomarina sp.]|uniref:RluA family pseudouridine synthase n=1 Tax=Pseudidiomarina sp. TaxID=2081707 RepID=UPI00299DC28E|nr:RluA family pseudouridine synthase [Pseudidiomarina sp.]MDX1706595.1 RluA family pseudouridine synthase [Pseudidiomarina sp.]